MSSLAVPGVVGTNLQIGEVAPIPKKEEESIETKWSLVILTIESPLKMDLSYLLYRNLFGSLANLPQNAIPLIDRKTCIIVNDSCSNPDESNFLVRKLNVIDRHLAKAFDPEMVAAALAEILKHRTAVAESNVPSHIAKKFEEDQRKPIDRVLGIEPFLRFGVASLVNLHHYYSGNKTVIDRLKLIEMAANDSFANFILNTIPKVWNKETLIKILESIKNWDETSLAFFDDRESVFKVAPQEEGQLTDDQLAVQDREKYLASEVARSVAAIFYLVKLVQREEFTAKYTTEEEKEKLREIGELSAALSPYEESFNQFIASQTKLYADKDFNIHKRLWFRLQNEQTPVEDPLRVLAKYFALSADDDDVSLVATVVAAPVADSTIEDLTRTVILKNVREQDGEIQWGKKTLKPALMGLSDWKEVEAYFDEMEYLFAENTNAIKDPKERIKALAAATSLAKAFQFLGVLHQVQENNYKVNDKFSYILSKDRSKVEVASLEYNEIQGYRDDFLNFVQKQMDYFEKTNKEFFLSWKFLYCCLTAGVQTDNPLQDIEQFYRIVVPRNFFQLKLDRRHSVACPQVSISFESVAISAKEAYEKNKKNNVEAPVASPTPNSINTATSSKPPAAPLLPEKRPSRPLSAVLKDLESKQLVGPKKDKTDLVGIAEQVVNKRNSQRFTYTTKEGTFELTEEERAKLIETRTEAKKILKKTKSNELLTFFQTQFNKMTKRKEKPKEKIVDFSSLSETEKKEREIEMGNVVRETLLGNWTPNSTEGLQGVDENDLRKRNKFLTWFLLPSSRNKKVQKKISEDS